jgi:hypothetical protein
LFVFSAWSNGKLFIFGGEASGIRNDLFVHTFRTHHACSSGAVRPHGQRDGRSSVLTVSPLSFRLFFFFRFRWSYDPLADEWTWLNGGQSSTVTSVHAHVMAVGASPNATSMTPPHRLSAFMTAAYGGKLWLIGGQSDNGPMGDVWSYEPASDVWTLEAGSQTPVAPSQASYGRFRWPSDNNLMPGRRDFAAAFDKHANVIFVSGGVGEERNGDSVYLADVWAFNVVIRQYTWVGGTPAISDKAIGTYPSVKGLDGGAVHAVRPNNWASSAWVDHSGGLWLGMGYYGNQEQMCNGSNHTHGQLWAPHQQPHVHWRRSVCKADFSFHCPPAASAVLPPCSTPQTSGSCRTASPR